MVELTSEQSIYFFILAAMIVAFALDFIRYDIVALGGLAAMAGFGIIPFTEMFNGFANQAIFIVAIFLVLSKALMNVGFAEIIATKISKVKLGVSAQIGLLTLIVAVTSAFVSNMGALLLFMPVAMKMAKDKNLPVGLYLLPIAFASHFGGYLTVISTPANIIVSNYRGEELGQTFSIFQFAPPGIIVLLVATIFIAALGWRFIPRRFADKSEETKFEISDYTFEVIVPNESKFLGQPISDIEEKHEGITVLSLIRGKDKKVTPSLSKSIEAGDKYIVRSEQDNLGTLLNTTDFRLAGEKDIEEKHGGKRDVDTYEAVVLAESALVGKTSKELELRTKHKVNLLAISRSEKEDKPLNEIDFQPGDAIILQGTNDDVQEFLDFFGCLPVADRPLLVGNEHKITITFAIFFVTILMTVLTDIAMQFWLLLGLLALVGFGVVTPKKLYKSIDWPIIILIGAMIPIGGALQTIGGSELIADFLLSVPFGDSPLFMMLLIYVVTILLSDFVNNTATVVLLLPIALLIAVGLGVSPDPMLLAVAFGASSSYLTPVGHQSNTVVYAPGGFRFTDYAYLGFPLQILILLVSIPAILIFFPF